MSDFYRALEERFRASREEIQARLATYRPFLEALLARHTRSQAFDIGCGRGEWLQMLGEMGFDAQGVDLDDAMLAACHEAGLNARNQDALSALQAAPDDCYQLITSFHVVEHLDFGYLQLLLNEARRTLAPDGLLILETPNSENLMVGTSSFYLDPTHHRPVPALFLEFLCQQSGFSRCMIMRLQEDPALASSEASIGLWQVLYGVSPDYAIVAQKQPQEADESDVFAELFALEYGLSLEKLALRHDRQVADKFQQLASDQAAAHQWLEERLTALTEQYEQTEAALQQVYLSRSWRITQPMRDLADSVRHTDRNWARRLMLRPLRAGLFHLRKKPALTASILRGARHIPGLESRLRRLQMALERPEHAAGHASVEYPPRVVSLASRLGKLADPARPQPAAMPARPRLAFVTPLPPERTGIADYSAALLPELSAYFQIDVIVEQDVIEARWISDNCQTHDAGWLRENADAFDAVLYHVGNSAYHDWMFSLVQDVPGILVLHDFFLSGLIWSLEAMPQHQGVKLKELYYSHGYPALAQALQGAEGSQIAFRYPFNRTIIESAVGVIVHSEVSFRLAQQWFGDKTASNWRRIPLLRVPAAPMSSREARERLQLPESAFVVCSYGQLGVTKLNHRLLQAWLASDLARNPDCILVFVGELSDDEYGQSLRAAMIESGIKSQIRITGWASGETFRDYLAAADIAVQLRTLSRGETSAAVLDCMNYGLPTIVNANGSMADLSPDGIYRLADDFETADLSAALEHFWSDPTARGLIGKRAKDIVETLHSPAGCARLYRDAISDFITSAQQTDRVLLDAVKSLPATDQGSLLVLAERLAKNQAAPARQPQLLLDITATSRLDLHTGIERVAKALTLALLAESPVGYRIEPVYLSDQGGRWHYKYASECTARLLGIPEVIQDRGVDYAAGDRLLALDYSGEIFIRASEKGLFTALREQGVQCRMLVHDLLPVTRPELFPPNANTHFGRWLDAVTQLDGAICVTRTVADELSRWLQVNHPERSKSFTLGYSHHGADISGSAPSRGLPDDAEQILSRLAKRPSILMVGTLEPRKGYTQALAAFTGLWNNGVELNLVIVGREGWRDLPDEQRREIPELIRQLRHHPERGQRLFWLDGISDEFLEKIYAAADGLLAASLDEGFGLPLIEAAQKRLPILARDIPVFREVAANHACFFRADSPSELGEAISAWQAGGFKPSAAEMPWLTWRQSADNLQRILLAPEQLP
ncbi:glycosyltransferase [Stutzerimonas stutzeri]|nr:glycosyltransferase [Stutzerimonas stutzeri]